jgi:transcriptional regulator with XRE-family HTH domain
MTEHDKARAWRENLGLSKEQLARFTGYSREAIHLFERGSTPTRTWSTRKAKYKAKPLDFAGPVWQRYRNVCAGVQAQIEAKRRFEWK